MLVEQLTTERVKAHFQGLVLGPVERFELPNLNALNFLLHGALDGVPGAERLDALSRRFVVDPEGMARLSGAERIRERARDLQFVFDGGAARLVPTRVDVPFGPRADGTMLSDHIGYTVHYSLQLANRT